MITLPDNFIFLPLLIAFLITGILTPVFIYINKKIGLIDDPKRHKHPAMIHSKPVPRGGGIPIFLGTFIAGLLFLPLNSITIALFLAAFLALSVGVVDDMLNARGKEVSPYLRFGINIATALIVVGGGIGIKFITNPLGIGVIHFAPLIDEIFSVIWLIWIMNMLNWSKGVDGQMPGIVAISAIVIGLLSIKLNGLHGGLAIDAILSFIIAGSALGFLLYNFYPAKIFPGYGATSLYLLLGVAAMLSSTKLATAILVMSVPLVDFVFTIIRRIMNKKSPFKGDNKHLHHILLKLGYSQRQVALFYWCISAILGMIALTLESKSKLFAIIMVGVVTGGGLFFLHFITKHTDDEATS